MTGPTLLDRIKRAIDISLKESPNTNEGQFKRLMLVVGNGMTRISAGMEGTDFEWRNWAKNTLRAAGAPQDLSYLEALGYNYSEIFEYATWLAQKNENNESLEKTWRYLWDFVVKVPASLFQLGLVSAADHIITTNYDDIIEHSADKLGQDMQIRAKVRYLRADLAKFETLPGSSGEPEQKIFKIHGSLPRRGSSEKENDEKFKTWYERGHESTVGPTTAVRGPEQTVTIRKVYDKYAMTLPEEGFLDTFKELFEELTKPNTLVMFMGVGLRAEELILTRLLTYCLAPKDSSRSAPSLAAVVIDPPLDPLYKYVRFGIKPIRIPLGLVSSPATRAVAHLAVLSSLLDRMNSPRRLLISGLLDNFKSTCEQKSQILAVGQSALNRVHGIETAVAQEQAYAPRHELSWVPPEAPSAAGRAPQWLSSVEIGGQVLIPALVFDALGISCSIASQIYTDEVGRRVLRRLGRTSRMDYEWIALNQTSSNIPKLNESVPETDNSTTVTWMGLRTIIDSRPRVGTKLKFQTGNVATETETNFFGLGAKVLYTSKDLWRYLEPKLASLAESQKPLIVYDSGGAGEYSAEEWVAKNEGIIIASALAALVWFAVKDSSKEERDEVKEAWRLKFDKDQPKDDRGRIYQLQQFLEKLQSPDSSPWFLQDPSILGKARSFVVTLGELGMVYWYRNELQWLGPFWSGIEKDLKDADVRCGLACGDVARAGFAAALLPLDEQRKPSLDTIHHAIRWANWFGAQKIKYLSIEDFLDFLTAHRIGEVLAPSYKALDGPQTGTGTVSLGCSNAGCGCRTSISFSYAIANGVLPKRVEKWIEDSKDWFIKGETQTVTRENWVRKVEKWREDRGYPKPR